MKKPPATADGVQQPGGDARNPPSPLPFPSAHEAMCGRARVAGTAAGPHMGKGKTP